MRRSLFLFMLIMLIVLALGLLVAGIFFYLDRQSPRYALRQITYNIRVQNYKEFFDYLDLPAISQGLVREAGQDLAKEATGNSLDRLGRVLGGKLAIQLVPRLMEGVDKPVRRLITDYLRTLTPEDIAALEEAVDLATIEVSKSGDEARVTLPFQSKNDKLRLIMRRDKAGGRWRVFNLNYQDFMRFFERN